MVDLSYGIPQVLTGMLGGITPTGNVTYTFDTNLGEIKTVDAAGLIPDSSVTDPLTDGQHGYQAVYSGDPNYLPATAEFEPLTVFTPPTGCTGTIGYWANHPCSPPITVPISIGSTTLQNIEQVVNVESINKKIDYANDGTICKDGPSNGIVMLDAQFLAAKLAAAQTGPNKADTSNATLQAAWTAAEAFRTTYDCTDWTNAEVNQTAVREWTAVFNDFNNGLLGPGHCQTQQCPAAPKKNTIHLGGGNKL